MRPAQDVAFTGELLVEEPQLRITEGDAVTALRSVAGEHVVPARARLRFGPGRTYECLARLLDRAIAGAVNAGLDPALLVLADGTAQAAEDIVRVRRMGYGIADWVHSPTCRVQIALRPAGLRDLADPASPRAAGEPAAPVPLTDVSMEPEPVPDQQAVAVREMLSEVIDPDLGVNIVDLGFVRAVTVADGTAIVTMTLTSPACPLTGNMENQIRSSLADLDGIVGSRIDWEWIPAWRPAHVTEAGREQLRAVGFTI